MDEKEDKIKLPEKVIYYGKTTVEELKPFGYRIEKDNIYFHEESLSIMCGFYKDDIYMGELAFFDVERKLSIKELEKISIDLVLFEEEKNYLEKNASKKSIKKVTKKSKENFKKNFRENIDDKYYTKSFRKFMEFTGKSGRKDVKFLAFGYLFCWIIIVLCYKNIPKDLIYITTFLPMEFFTMAFIFWIIKRFFSFLYYKTSKILYVSLCILLFLGWNFIASKIIFQYKTPLDSSIGSLTKILFIGFFLCILGFLSYQIIMFWFFDNKVKNIKDLIKKYSPIHLILYGILFFGKDYVLLSKNSFLFMLLIQLGFYGLISLALWGKLLLSILIFGNK